MSLPTFSGGLHHRISKLSRPVQSTALIVLSTLAADQAAAQNPNVISEEIVVTSSRLPLPAQRLGTSVSVLDEDDIRSYGNQAVADILRQTPAVTTSSNGGMGQPTSVRIRGEEVYRTLTILDGIRILDPSGVQVSTPFEHLLSEGVGRIEILRGPQGLAYGADAGGVVNISSRRFEDGFLFSGDLQTGRYGTNQSTVNLGGSSDRLDYFLSASDYSSQGFNTRQSDTSLVDDDGYDNTSLHARLGFELSEQLRLEMVHRNTDAESEFDGCFTVSRVEECEARSEISASRIALHYSGTSFAHSLSYNDTSTDRDSFASNQFSFGAEGELERWEYIGSASDLPGFDLVFGADQETATSNGVGRDNNGVFLEYLSDFSETLFLTAGIRHDENDDFGSNTSHRLSAAYLLPLDAATLKVRGAIGTGFRAPSPYEVAYNAGPFAFPPAAGMALAQEESRGWEVGLEYYIDQMHLEAVYFDQEIDNAIYFDFSAFSGYLQDVGRGTSRGLELSGRLPVSETWQLIANYTYNDTERPDGSPRLLRPENLFNAGALYTSSDSRIRFAAYYRSQTDARDIGNLTVDGYDIVDLNASVQVSDSLRLYARVENLLDEDYVQVNDYNSPASAAYIGVNYSFTR
jgi:vitamin B12 transporter